MVISLRRLPRTGERGGSGDGAAQANTRRCPEAGQRDQEIGRLPGCCAERKMVVARKRAWTGSQRSEDNGCTSGVLLRIPAQMTQRDGAGLAGERNTAGVHDGPRTDERWARAWVRKPGRATLDFPGQPTVLSAIPDSIFHVHRRRAWLLRANPCVRF